MYRDKSLIPTETVRLAALGMLAERNWGYADLAGSIRHFIARVAGPSLDLLGSSLELLCYEGLLVTVDGGQIGEDSMLRISEEGRATFATLMTSNVRAPLNDVGKLVIALKLRFLHLLPEDEQRDQMALLIEIGEAELARLEDLKSGFGGGHLADWLDFEIAQTRDRIVWFESVAAKI